MSNRVEKLFLLLRDKHNTLVRETAAQQLGEIAQVDVSQVDIIVDGAYKLLFDSSWEARTAGGIVLDEIVKHVGVICDGENTNTLSSLSVQGFDINKVMKNKNHLTQSNTEQTYLDTFLTHHHIENELISLLLLQRIGIISNEEESTLNQLKSKYIQEIEEKNNNNNDHNDNNNDNNECDITLHKIESYLETLKETETETNTNTNTKSAKKSNKLKDSDFKLLMRVRPSLHPKNELLDDIDNKNKSNNKNECIVFNKWYRKLLPFLLHSQWEYRHGASIGLRSFLKSLVYIGNNEANEAILIEGSLMCLSVLILDRFFDFQSDILIAPISETVAQCLSLFMKYIENDASFVSIIKLLLKCIDNKSWNIRYCGYLALKYIVPLHFERIIDLKLDMNMIECSCNGMKDDMEDVRNMSSQVLLSNICVFLSKNDQQSCVTMDTMLNALLYALDEIDEYCASTLGVINVLYHVLHKFPELIIDYIDKENVNKRQLCANIFNVLLKIMNHSSLSMKKQSVVTLHKFMDFVHRNNMNINEKDVIVWIQTVFEKIMCEENKKIKETIEVLKDNDFDEYKMDVKYKSYINDLKQMWKWICCNLQYLIKINTQTLPIQYQQMILKLLESFQHNATVTKKQNNNDKETTEEQIPTHQLLQQIEDTKRSKKRKHNPADAHLEPPVKKRKINSNDSQNIQNTKDNYDYEYPQEMILWDIIDCGSQLLSKLFTSKPLNTMSWNIVQHLLLQFLYQKPKQKQKKKKKKRIIYGWRRIFGCWLLADCYHELKQYKEEMKENAGDDMGMKIKECIHQLQKVNHDDIYGTYNELKFRRKMIKHQTQHLMETFGDCDTVYNDMNTYFNDAMFCDYIKGVTTKYNEWKSKDTNGDKERDECYKLLLATVLNAQYALDYHGLLLQCSLSHILMNNGCILKDGADIEAILEPVMSVLKSADNGCNLQYRSAECMALTMKLLCDVKQGEGMVSKILNNIVTDCRDNITIKPKDATRMSIQCICDVFGDDVFTKLPFILNKMREIFDIRDDDGFYCDCDWISMTQILCCFISSVASSEMRQKYLLPFIDVMFDGIYLYEEDDEDGEEEDEMWSICAQSRHCIMEYLQFEPHIILQLIISHVIPSLKRDDGMHRLGAIELIWDIFSLIDSIQSSGNNINNNNVSNSKCKRYSNYSRLNVIKHGSSLLLSVLPYLSLLIVPLLHLQTDCDDCIRMKANQIFSVCVRLIALDIGLNDDVLDKLPSSLRSQRDENILILKQLINPSLISDDSFSFKSISSSCSSILRDYQCDGIKWLWFLRRFHLDGILADDMGLGKTLQALFVIAASYRECNSVDPSLIVCPSTLIYHWNHEICKFKMNSSLHAFIIDGNRNKRRSLYDKLASMNGNLGNTLVIMSYHTLSNDIEQLNELISSQKWKLHYMMLDEGHLIRNPKTAISRRVKQLAKYSSYRLILSGTPIHNNVLDLWSLFDFLMPQFLGNESWFRSNFSSPITKSYNNNNTNDAQIGAHKLSHLHKQCLPFILRRLKCDVLKELPPKIIQNIEIDMSSIQSQLYKEFLEENENKMAGIQSLIYLRKLVFHPKLIMTPAHPSFTRTLHGLQECNLSLESIEISPKFIALKSLIEQCTEGATESHRILIFVQYVESIELICDLLLNKYFPKLKYLRLTSKLTTKERFDCVSLFNKLNSDISLLLMTVSVGGLGLNLNTADIVIFMEMDWNPMKDLQAMDRAHRIGQHKTVHVFRIIVRNSIESDIMKKQKFKQYCANSVISKENQSMTSITSNSQSILDLFCIQNDDDKKKKKDCIVDAYGEINKNKTKQKHLNQMLDELGNMTLIDEQYAEQYDLNKFIANLR